MTKYIYPAKAKPSKINWFAKFLGISALVGSLGWGLWNVETYIKEALQSYNNKKVLENLVDYSFFNPFEIQIQKENQGLVAYIFDAGDRTIHGFSSEGHTNGQYVLVDTPPVNSIDAYEKYFAADENKKYASFIIRGGKVYVNNLDKTIIEYNLPNLKFSRRIEGSRLTQFGKNCNIPENVYKNAEYIYTDKTPIDRMVYTDRIPTDRMEYTSSNIITKTGFFSTDLKAKCGLCEGIKLSWRNRDLFRDDRDEIEKYITEEWIERSLPRYVAERVLIDTPTHYMFFHDKPSRKPINFTALFPLVNFNFKLEGECNLLSVIGFINSEERILLGSMCNDGDVEQYYSIPYEQAGIAKSSTPATIFSVGIYEDTIYFIKKGNKKVNKVQILSANQK